MMEKKNITTKKMEEIIEEKGEYGWFMKIENMIEEFGYDDLDLARKEIESVVYGYYGGARGKERKLFISNGIVFHKHKFKKKENIRELEKEDILSIFDLIEEYGKPSDWEKESFFPNNGVISVSLLDLLLFFVHDVKSSRKVGKHSSSFLKLVELVNEHGSTNWMKTDVDGTLEVSEDEKTIRITNGVYFSAEDESSRFMWKRRKHKGKKLMGKMKL